MEPDRWSLEQVLAVAPSPGAVTVAESLAAPTCWSGVGADDRAVWGRCQGSSHEPYDTVVDHVGVGWRCSCPSRVRPCKHALALLLRWARGEIPPATPPPAVAAWSQRRSAAAEGAHDRPPGPGSPPAPTDGAPPVGSGSPPAPTDGAPPVGSGGSSEPTDGARPAAERPDAPDRGTSRDERLARMRAGLVELERWLEDRMRTGLNDPSLARYSTWDELAARLVDARVGGLANRVRRLAGLVGVGTDWHDRVLAELGMLHLLAQGALRGPELPDGRTGDEAVDALGDLAGAVAIAAGWQVRQADVLAGVPETDDWVVAGRSDTREDRIEVRRTWLWGRASRRWAMSLSFAAYGQGLDESLRVGEVHHGDLFRYPGSGLRALLVPAGEGRSDDADIGTDTVTRTDAAVGATTGIERHGSAAAPDALDVVGACRAVGTAIAAEPWIERVAVTVSAAPTVAQGRWVLGDRTGSLPLVGAEAALATLVAASVGRPVPVTVEWTPWGLVPLTVHLPDRAVDVGPRADPSFVGTSR